jgi:hypothetical protein
VPKQDSGKASMVWEIAISNVSPNQIFPGGENMKRLSMAAAALTAAIGLSSTALAVECKPSK